ncbi:MAG: sugar porter family MFS transporter [Undibacterium sp.]|nr:sugar porter family MFS transporter [Opitutaceae bacterium]
MISANPTQTPSAPDGGKINRAYLGAISVVAALGGLLFGYDWVVIGGAAKFYEAFFHLTDTATTVAAGASWWEKIRSNAISPIGWAQSCALLGCLVGAVISGALSDRFGRKPVLIAAAVNFVVSSVAIAFAGSFSGFVAWRILGGVSIGLASNISPLYISEIAPTRHRGLLVAVNQLTIVVGVLAAQFINWRIAEPVPAGLTPGAFLATWNVQTGWRWMFAACALPSVLFFLSSLFVPESPRWLAKVGRHAQARAVLTRIGGPEYAAAALAEIDATVVTEKFRVRIGVMQDRRLLAVLGLGVSLAVFQQWCGINVIFNYAGEIFAQAGYNLDDTLTNIVMTGLVNLVFTFVALFTVDRLGRKPLMLFGAAALSVIYVAIGLAYYTKSGGGHVSNALFLGLVLAAIGSYAMSLAPVTWVIISEIFPNRIRGTAMSVAVSCLWIACFLLTYTFPIFNALLGPAGTFWIYAGICVLGFVFILFRLPETKGKSLEQIEREMVGS